MNMFRSILGFISASYQHSNQHFHIYVDIYILEYIYIYIVDVHRFIKHNMQYFFIFFSVTLIKRFISYCKNIAQTKQNIKETATDLESVTEKEEYFNIEDTIQVHATKTKCLLHQRSKNQKIKSKKNWKQRKRKNCNHLRNQLRLRKYI